MKSLMSNTTIYTNTTQIMNNLPYTIPSSSSYLKQTGRLNYPMIGRIYTAKPGCGSCGK